VNFKIIFSPKSYRQIKKLRIDVKKRINEAILKIKENPFHKGTIKIKDYNNIRRKRVGKYRILYTTESEKKEVLIVKIELRSETTYK
jgi:mRNA-degrading endonuclease RelE of RelBE toxin-antitoxin system